VTALAAGDTRPTGSPAVGRANGVHPDWLRMSAIAEPLVKHFALTPKAAVQQSVNADAADKLDADLERSAQHSAWMRRGFYVVVLLTALAGQVSGAVVAIRIPVIWAIPATCALELGGVVVMANADIRRRLGERAVVSRLLSAVIAGWAVGFNWLAHANHMQGGFFAFMSALGYCVWMMHTENQRRDRLRALGNLPPVPPAYELWSHWMRHPGLTLRARTLAKKHAHLDLYGSLDEAHSERTRERRTHAIGAVLKRQISRTVKDRNASEIALTTYDMDEVAERIQAHVDYDRLAALVVAAIDPDVLTGRCASDPEKSQVNGQIGAHVDTLVDAVSDAPQTHPDAPTEAVSSALVQTHLELVTDAPAEPRRARPAAVAKTHSGARSPDAKAVAQVRALAQRSGGTPSVRRVMTELNVGAPKAKEYLRLAAESSDTEETP